MTIPPLFDKNKEIPKAKECNQMQGFTSITQAGSIKLNEDPSDIDLGDSEKVSGMDLLWSNSLTDTWPKQHHWSRALKFLFRLQSRANQTGFSQP